MLPHAIRILERDCSARIESVRNSAIKGLQEIEMIIHVRLPPQKTPALPKTLEDEEGDENEGNDIEIPEKIIAEENVVENAYAEPIVEPKLFDAERPVASPSASITTIAEIVRPSLPAFVTTTQGQSSASFKEVPPTSSIERPKLFLGDEVTPASQTKTVAAITKPDNTRDIFASGGWKDVRTTTDDEDEEIPEIDMGFDSDDG